MDILSQPLIFAPLPDVAAMGRKMLYQFGQDAYLKGYELDFLSSPEARKGWFAANRAEAEMLTPAYAESMGW